MKLYFSCILRIWHAFLDELYRSVGQERTSYTTCTALADTYTSAIRTLFLVGGRVISIAPLVEVMDSAVLGAVVDVVRSNPAVGQIFF